MGTSGAAASRGRDLESLLDRDLHLWAFGQAGHVGDCEPIPLAEVAKRYAG
jgi:hypothetical protein